MIARLSKSHPGPYDVIYADPAWKYNAGSAPPINQIERKYPTMTLKAICSLPVIDIAAPDSVLFLWTTSPKLMEAGQVIYAWGFEYQSSIIWDKLKMGMGYRARIQHEVILIATRGDPGVPPVSARPRSVLRCKPTIHSRKPDFFRTMIVNMYPDARRIELFARQRKPGWDCWGNDPAILEGA